MNIEETAKTLYGIKNELVDEAVRFKNAAEALEKSAPPDDLDSDDALLWKCRRDKKVGDLLSQRDMAAGLSTQIYKLVADLVTLEDK